MKVIYEAISIGEATDTTQSVCEKALEKMPADKVGIVLGSGQNTESWRARGWQTLDIDTTAGADRVGDANELSNVCGPDSMDFIYCEGIAPKTVENHPEWVPLSERGALEEASRTLKAGGYYITRAALRESTQGGEGVSLDEYISLLKEKGFTGVALVSEPYDILNTTGTPLGVYRSSIFFAQKL